MTRGHRTLVKLGVALVSPAVLFVVTAAIVHATWNDERAARSISGWASKDRAGHGGPTDQALVIERVHYPLWGALRSVLGGRPVRVEVDGFHIYGRDGEEAIGARHVSVGVRLGRLVWREIWSKLPGTRGDLELYFDHAVPDGVRADIHRDQEGRINLVAALKRRPTTLSDPPIPEPKPGNRGGMIIDVDGAVVRDARFGVHMRAMRTTLEQLGLEVSRLHYSSFPEEQLYDAPAFTYRVGWVAAQRGEVVVGAQRFPLDHVTASEFRAEEPVRTSIHFSAVTRCDGATIKAHGSLLEVYGKPGLDVHLEATHGARILAQLPAKKWLSGDFSATAHVTGKATDLRIAGEASHLDAHVEHVELKDVRGEFVFAHQTFAAAKLHSLLAGGTLDADGNVTLGSGRFRVDARPHDLDLGKLRLGGALELVAAFTALTAKPGPSGELENDFRLHGLDIHLYRRGRLTLPDRIVVESAPSR